MKVIDQIQQSIMTIEEQLFTDILIEELASSLGYSVDHYMRLFKEYVGMPLSSYIKKRRIEVGILRIASGESIVDTAHYCGYDTHAGFYKAFKNQYGCSPRKYLKLNSVGPTTPMNLLKESKKLMNKNVMLKILANWDVQIESKEIDKLDLSHALRGNHTYKISNRFMFKSDVNIDHLITQIKMGNNLKAEGINVPRPIQTKNGEDYIVVDDVYYMLLNYLEGDILTTTEQYNGDCTKLGNQIGEALGKLHIGLKDLDGEIEIKDVDFKHQMINWAIPAGRKLAMQWDLVLPSGFFDSLEIEILDNVGLLPKQIIHRDPNPTNYLFKDGKFSGFLDFEISENNIRIFDLAYVLTGLYIDTPNVDNGIDKWLLLKDGVINGYNKVNELLEVEHKMLPTVMISIQLIFIAYLEGMENQLELLKRNHKMLEELVVILL